MESPSDTGNMVHESKMPEPVAWIVRYPMCEDYLDWDEPTNGSFGKEPLYTAADLELAKQEATRQAMEQAAKAVREGLMMEPLTAEKIIRALIPPPPTSGNGEGGGNG